MIAPSSPEEQKRRVLETFNALAETYDSLRFVKIAASRMLELVDLRPGMRVLDVGTGTGLVATTAARIVGPTGKVTGLDLSPEMIARAVASAASAGVPGVEFQVGDAEHLEFPDESFDVVLYGSSLFFVPDMVGTLREARRVLAPGGRVAFTCFAEGFMQPLRDLWEARVQRYGIKSPPPANARLIDLAANEKILREAGFGNIEVRTEAHGYFLPDGNARWDEILASMEGKALQSLTSAQREQIRTEHLTELEAITTPEGLWFDVNTNFASGQK